MMRAAVLLAGLLLSVGALAAATTTSYWVCMDAQGRKTAQDQPCPEPTGGEESGPSTESRASVTTAQRPLAKAIKQPDYSQFFKPIIDAAWWVVLLLVAGAIGIAVFKILSIRRSQRAAAQALIPERIAWTEPDSHAPARVTPKEPVSKHPPSEWSLELIRELEWLRFEELCQGVWKAKGYPAEMTSLGPDGGVDVVIRDQADAAKTFAVIQCKAWTTGVVGVEKVRALWGSTQDFGARLAIFYGLSGFSEGAQRFAEGKNLRLRTGTDLLAEIRMLGEEQQQELLTRITRGDYATPSCPACGEKMVRRSGAEGREDFWGCRRYPVCRGGILPARA